jgi:hypothetical protein
MMKTWPSNIRTHLGRMRFGGGPVRLYDLRTILGGVLAEAKKKTYRDDPVIVAMKSLLELDLVKERNGNS